MAVFTPSYPLTLPTATGIKTQNWSLRRITSITQSPFTLQQQVYQHSGEQWGATMTLPPMLKDKASIWLSFFLQLRGVRGTFKLGDQDRKTIQGIITSTIETGKFTKFHCKDGRMIMVNDENVNMIETFKEEI